MTPPTIPDQPSTAEPPTVTRRVTKRIEAVNERVSSAEAGAFDFAVEGGTPDDPALGLLASYLGVAAADRSAALGLALDVNRVVVEVEGGTTRSDGGTVDFPGEDGFWRAAPPRAATRALVEAHTDEPADRLAAWRDQLVGDDVPFSMVPGLVGVDLLVTTRGGGREEH
jgi:hypothetical protein